MVKELLSGGVALVTGAAGGLGAGIAGRIVEAGSEVALFDLNEDRLISVAQPLLAAGARVTIHVGDVQNPQSVDNALSKVIQEHGKLTSVVNNAAVIDRTAFLDIEMDGWNRVLGIDLTGCFVIMQRAGLVMKKSGGAIVNIASISSFGVDGAHSSYIAAKSGLAGLTKSAAVELAPYGIRVNAVSPGWINHRMTGGVLTEAETKYVSSGNFARVPMRRMIEIEEVANTVAFLLSGMSSAITGVNLPVDGGTLATLYVNEAIANG